MCKNKEITKKYDLFSMPITCDWGCLLHVQMSEMQIIENVLAHPFVKIQDQILREQWKSFGWPKNISQNCIEFRYSMRKVYEHRFPIYNTPIECDGYESSYTRTVNMRAESVRHIWCGDASCVQIQQLKRNKFDG